MGQIMSSSPVPQTLKCSPLLDECLVPHSYYSPSTYYVLGRQCAERFSDKVLIPGRSANLPQTRADWIPTRGPPPCPGHGPPLGPTSCHFPSLPSSIRAFPPLWFCCYCSRCKNPTPPSLLKAHPPSCLAVGRYVSWYLAGCMRHVTDLILFILHLPLSPAHSRAFVTTCQTELNECLPQNTEQASVYSPCIS